MKRCHRCGTEWVSEKRQPGVKEYCANCSAYLHCCRNCRFHDTTRHNECKIPNTDWVGDRNSANFCGEFEFADTALETGGGEKEQDARRALDGLLGNEDGSGRKPSSFDDLFRE